MWGHILVAVLVGIPRIIGVNHQTYQAIAHLYMGGAITMWYLFGPGLWMWIVLGLSALEVACFVRDKVRKKRTTPTSFLHGRDI